MMSILLDYSVQYIQPNGNWVSCILTDKLDNDRFINRFSSIVFDLCLAGF